MLNSRSHCYRLASEAFSPPRRSITQSRQLEDLKQLYEVLKHESQSSTYPYSEKINPNGIFANNELDLQKIKVYGFDFDYTLARYKPTLHSLIYDNAKTFLVKNLRYPDALMNFSYRPGMGARGLHLDIKRGWLMKVDSYHNIQLGTVYHGMRAVSDEEVLAAHHGTKLTIDVVGYLGRTSNMFQFVDIFSIPEITLLRDVTQYFIDNSIPFATEYVHYDVQEAVSAFHKSGAMHRIVGNNVETYFEENARLKTFLQRLRDANKQIFIITNSAYWYVNHGMSYLLGENWQDFFDIIICQARKPSFFAEQKRPFREIDVHKNSKSWARVQKLEHGKVYVEVCWKIAFQWNLPCRFCSKGNLTNLISMTNWQGNDVLYIGDHIYGDLADLFLKYGWRTGAILEEVEDEINIMNSDAFQKTIRWLTVLQWLTNKLQVIPGPEADLVMKNWLAEQDAERAKSRDLLNPYFGSIFRTHTVPTYFHRRLARFADVYTSNVCNFLSYPLDYIFFPRRLALPHENVLPTPDLNLLLMKSISLCVYVCAGRFNDDITRALLPDASEDKRREIDERKDLLFHQLVKENLQPTKGLPRIIAYIQENRSKFKLGLATNAIPSVTEFGLTFIKIDMKTFLDAIIIAKELGIKMYLKLTRRLNVEKNTRIVFEDSASGVRAAVVAEIKRIGVLTSAEKETLEEYGTWRTVKNFEGMNWDEIFTALTLC
ncbi:unnamed protein product [Adineta ricciae]|uniref:Uncharacterized protein n=1 Tax=Adineta ricciae TaxID=249248 RepID=A0A815RDW1_ADIRI|nr:unnamed protein product [Adineta ricciae]